MAVVMCAYQQDVAKSESLGQTVRTVELLQKVMERLL